MIIIYNLKTGFNDFPRVAKVKTLKAIHHREHRGHREKRLYFVRLDKVLLPPVLYQVLAATLLMQAYVLQKYLIAFLCALCVLCGESF